MNKFIFTVLITGISFGASLLSAYVVVSHLPIPVQNFGNIEAPVFKFQNSTSTNVSTVSVPLVASTTGRRILIIQNVGSSPAYCSFGGLPGIDQQGFLLTASSTHRFPSGGEPMYAGAVNCIASTSVKIVANEAY